MSFPTTIPELLTWRAAREPTLKWLFFQDRSWTLADVAREVDRWAVGFAARGVQRGDRVAMMLGNCPETLFAWLGVNSLGAIAVVLNPGLTAFETAGHLRRVEPRLVVVLNSVALITEACALASGARIEVVSPLDLPLDGTPPDVQVAPDDVCTLITTSGTTGAPKAVMQTHRAYVLTAEAFPAWIGLGAGERLLATLPFFHINAQAYSTMAALAVGTLAIMQRFSASHFWEDARALGATQFNSVGAMLNILLRTAPRPAEREHGMRTCYAALALPEATHRAFEERFNISLTVGYGMSETTFGTVWPHGEPPRYGTMGRLRQHPRLGTINEAQVVDGELWLRNPALMAGYFRDPEQTKAAIDEDGWLHTGDVVRRDDDGFFTFVSRRKDMLRRRGENIAAAEIETVLVAYAGIQEAAVIGVPSELGEDDIVAYVVLDAGSAPLDEPALVAFMKARLADFKVPIAFHVRADLPRTETGRVAKHKLRDSGG